MAISFKLDFIHLSQFESQLIGIESHILFILSNFR
jgi:hypothetical protein